VENGAIEEANIRKKGGDESDTQENGEIL